MNDDLKELGITPDHDMDEDPKVNDEVATGEAGDKDEDEVEEKEDLSLEEQEKLKKADAEDYEKDGE